jgi:outer membrane protein assembly factor BamD
MDQTATQDAIAAFDDYLARFPSGENATTARELRVSARTRLAEHDLYAAEFYAERQKWRGAAWRYERVAKEFADTPLAAEALLQAAQIHEGELAEPEQAKTLYTLLVEQHPSTDAARLAEQRLAALSGS